jgi:hypothetical protein
MEPLAAMYVLKSTRSIALSALPDAPTIPEREPTPRLPGTRRVMASGLRWAANRIEPCKQPRLA